MEEPNVKIESEEGSPVDYDKLLYSDSSDDLSNLNDDDSNELRRMKLEMDDDEEGEFLKINFDEDEEMPEMAIIKPVEIVEVQPAKETKIEKPATLVEPVAKTAKLYPKKFKSLKNQNYAYSLHRKILKTYKRMAYKQGLQKSPKIKRTKAILVRRPSSSSDMSNDEEDKVLVIDEKEKEPKPSTSAEPPKQITPKASPVTKPRISITPPDRPKIRRIDINEIAKYVAESTLRNSTSGSPSTSKGFRNFMDDKRTNDELIETIPTSIIVRKVSSGSSSMSPPVKTKMPMRIAPKPTVQTETPQTKLIIKPEEVKQNVIKYVVRQSTTPLPDEETEIKLISDDSLSGYELETEIKEFPVVVTPPPIKYSIPQDMLRLENDKIAENQKKGREVYADNLIKMYGRKVSTEETVAVSEQKIESESLKPTAVSSSRRKSNHVPKVDLDEPEDEKPPEVKEILPYRPQDNIDLIECLANYRVLATKLLEKIKIPELDLCRNTDDLVNIYKVLRN